MSELSFGNNSVTDFYTNISVFVTGGTGFIGKVLLEKLLYTCTGIDKIYILVRVKENSNCQQRLEEIVANPVFERIKKVNPQMLNKIIPIEGDIAKDNFGINSQVEQSFLDKISVVFHSAASIRFNEKLEEAVNLNLNGTKRVLKLCHRMKNLKSFVHFSTTFINPQNEDLNEIEYPDPVESEELDAFLERQVTDDKEIANFLRGRPNTYTFTKALAENYVAKNCGTIPTVIIRPSIVTASESEPFPGWIDSWAGSAGLLATTFLGYNRVVVGKSSNRLDLIPVDYVINLAIVAAARNHPNNLEIYNSCTSACNPLSMFELMKTAIIFSMKNGYNDIPLPFAFAVKDGPIKEILVFFLEKLPAMIADVFLRLKGKTPRYTKLQLKVSSSREILKFFSSHSYALSADKTISLSRSLLEKDARLFPFNPREFKWQKYIPIYMQGIRKYLLKK